MPTPTPTSFTCDFYAAPTGTSAGNGLVASPWDLQTALNKTAQVTSGKTLCVRGGTYFGKFSSALTGGTVRSAHGEWAVLDGYVTTKLSVDLNSSSTSVTVDSITGIFAVGKFYIDNEIMQVASTPTSNVVTVTRAWDGTSAASHLAGADVILIGNTLGVAGSNTTYIAFEVQNSSPSRDYATTLGKATQIGVYQPIGNGNSYINLIVHDNGGGGFFTGSSSSNTLLYGNIVYNNGVYNDVHGHGLYLENASGFSKVYDTIVLNNFNLGVQAYGVSGPYVGGDMRGIVVSGSGAPVSAANQNLLYGPDNVEAPTASVIDSWFQHVAGSGYSVQMGYGAGVGTATMTGNYFLGGTVAFQALDITALTFTGNKFDSASGEYVHSQQLAYTWNNNEYYRTTSGASNRLFKTGVGGFTIADWRTTMGFDSSTTISANPIPDTIVYRANPYNLGECNIYITAPSNPSSITVNLSTCGLTNQQQFVIKNASNYNGAPVRPGIATGNVLTYSTASPSYSLPMGVSDPIKMVAQPFAMGMTPATTCPQLCVLRVVPVSAGTAITPTSTATPTASPSATETTTPTGSFTPTETATLSSTSTGTATITATSTATATPLQGSITGSSAATASTVNLTSEGTMDWGDWGRAASPNVYNDKSGGTGIAGYTVIGGTEIQFTGNTVSYSWTDGTPTASATTDGAVYNIGAGNGFQVSVPSSTTNRIVKVYVGLYRARGKFEVWVDDDSAPDYIDTSNVNASGVSNFVYTIHYRSATSSTLNIKWTVNTEHDAFANVTWQAVTLIDNASTPTATTTGTPTNTATATNTATSTTTGTATPTPTAGGNMITVTTATPTGTPVPPQVMRGWEATAEAAQLYSPAWNNYKTALLDDAVNNLGINRVRLEVKSGVENTTDYFAQWRNGTITESAYNAKRYEIINDNSNANSINAPGFKWSSLDSTITNIVLPMRALSTARGETLWVNVNYVDFGSSSFEHKNSPAEYAEFVLATYQHIQSAFGFVPDSWEIVLEPDTASASWNSTQVANAVKAAGDRLAAAGYTPRFVVPSTTSAGNAVSYFNQIIATPGAIAYVDELSYHRYDSPAQATITAIASAAAAQSKRTAMLEWISADYIKLHEDLKHGNNSSWQQFTLAWLLNDGGDNGGHYYVVDDSNVSSPTYTLGSRTKLLRQYFKYIRYGAQRIGATSNAGSLDPLAFINTNGKYVVVVKSTSGGTFGISGIPSGTCGIKYSTEASYNIDLPDQPCASIVTTIPSSGALTAYSK